MSAPSCTRRVTAGFVVLPLLASVLAAAWFSASKRDGAKAAAGADSTALALPPAPHHRPGQTYALADAASASHVEYHGVLIPKGARHLLADLEGPGLVTYFYITDNSGGQLYPGLVLEVFWDDDKEPSVRAPLADFFGAFDQWTIDYDSAWMQVNHMCYMCYLPMPFARRAKFVLVNDGDRDYSRSVAYGIDYERSADFASEPSRLHCRWNRTYKVTDANHLLLDVHGHGHYIGNFLYVRTRSGGWWGEGDTIFTVDGTRFTHTPGTEDEYGSCWSFGHTFIGRECGYLQMEPDRHRMYRWYEHNPVRFRSSLKVEIQNQHQNGGPAAGDDYTSVAFWYRDGAAPCHHCYRTPIAFGPRTRSRLRDRPARRT